MNTTTDRPAVPRRARRTSSAYLFVLPMLTLVVVFRGVPLVVSGYFSLTDTSWDGVGRLVGAANYANLARDPLFWTSLRVTLSYALLAVPLTVGFGLVTALVLHHVVRGAVALRMVFFLPYMTSLVLASVVWHWVYAADGGLVNGLLGRVGVEPVPFLAGTDLTVWSLAAVGAWKGFGYSMLVLLAGLRAIPDEQREAAAVDGARGWSLFRHVTLPGLRPVLLFCVLVETVSSLHVFDLAYVMTGGGPARSSYTLVMNLYERGFRYFDFGYASAIGIVVTVVVATVSLTQWKLSGEGTAR